MASAGSVFLDVKPDMDGFQRNLSAGMQRSSSRLSSIGKAAGMAIATGLGAAVAGAGALAKVSINNAADLGEAINKTEVVFKGASKRVLDFSKTTANELGISRAAALDAAGGYGAMFNALGLARKPAADMSTSLVKLAADMGSLHNQDPTEMLDKIRAGMSGEMEPLKRFGIVLSETAVAEHAVKEGIVAVGEEMTEAQKVQARYSLLMEQSKSAHDDFGNTMNSLPNIQRRFGAMWTDLTAKLGKEFMPIAIKVGQFLIKNLPKAFEKVKEVFATLAPFFKTAFAVIQQIFGVFSDILSGNWKSLWDRIKRLLAMAWEGIKRGVKLGIDALLGFLKELPGMILSALGSLGQLLWDKGKELIGGLIGGIKEAAAGVGSAIGGAISSAASAINPFDNRAHGGPVRRGTPYIVGERGPELFRPSTSGMIVPHNQLTTTSGIVNQITVEADGRALTRTIETHSRRNQILLGGR